MATFALGKAGYTGATTRQQAVANVDNDTLAEDLARIGGSRCKAAFARVFKYFAPRLKAFGFKQFKNEQQALELVQETLLIIWNKAHLYDPQKAAVSTWVYRVARNQSYDMMRRQASRPDILSGDDLWPLENHEAEQQPADETILTEQTLASLAILPEPQRQVIERIYVNDMTQQEAADDLGIPLGTVKSRVRLALERLKEHLHREH